MSTVNLSFGISLIADRLSAMRSHRREGLDASPGNRPAIPTIAIGITGSSASTFMLFEDMTRNDDEKVINRVRADS